MSKFIGSLGEEKTRYASDGKIVRGGALKAVARETDVALISGKKIVRLANIYAKYASVYLFMR